MKTVVFTDTRGNWTVVPYHRIRAVKKGWGNRVRVWIEGRRLAIRVKVEDAGRVLDGLLAFTDEDEGVLFL